MDYTELMTKLVTEYSEWQRDYIKTFRYIRLAMAEAWLFDIKSDTYTNFLDKMERLLKNLDDAENEKTKIYNKIKRLSGDENE